MSVWSVEEITNILLQLEELGYPFKGYSFERTRKGLLLLGRGAFSYVFEVKKQRNRLMFKQAEKRYALSVIGFGSKRLDAAFFEEYIKNQRALNWSSNNVEEIYQYCQVVCRITEDGNVTGVEILDNLHVKEEENTLQLQFILMEKLEPVIRFSPSGEPQLYPEALARFEEGEIVKLTEDVGKALIQAHDANILHRDVKLENVFYSSELMTYKLGDFGISKITQDGLADTKTFTRGYGAPEVVIGEEYDTTVDIYSLGMVLYVLLNKLRFPGSDGYYPNQKVQYAKNAVLPEPETGSKELKETALCMCAFQPEERYPSVREALQDMDLATSSVWTGFQKRHANAYGVMSALFLIAGCFFWKLIFASHLVFPMTMAGYAFFITSMAAALLNAAKLAKLFDWLFMAAMIVFGGIWCFSTGFALWKLILLVFFLLDTDYCAAVISGVILMIKGMEVALAQGMFSQMAVEQSWTILFFLPSAFFLLWNMKFILDCREAGRIRSPYAIYFKKMPFTLYDTFLIIGFVLNGVAYWSDTNPVSLLLRMGIAGELARWHFGYAGLAGLVFWGFWNLREQVMIRIKKLISQ